MRKIFKPLLILCLAGLAGCVSYAPDRQLLGQDQAQVIASMGPPSRERQLPNGSRMEYPRGPFGKNTYFVFLDAQRKVTGWENVLTTQNFDKITPGMSAEDVTYLIGDSTSIFGVGQRMHKVWEYPFSNSICRVFQVEITPEGKVDSTGYGYAPECGSSW
jgi:hypothetical protein